MVAVEVVVVEVQHVRVVVKVAVEVEWQVNGQIGRVLARVFVVVAWQVTGRVAVAAVAMKREVVRKGVESLEGKKKTYCAGEAWQANGSATVTGVEEGGGVKTEGMLQQGVVRVASQTALELFVEGGAVVVLTGKAHG